MQKDLKVLGKKPEIITFFTLLFISGESEYTRRSKPSMKTQVKQNKNTTISPPTPPPFLLGSCFGILDTFLFWLLSDLGASKSLMGVTVAVGASAGIVTLMAPGFIIKRLGLPNTMILGFAFYLIRMLGELTK